jgi:hypothetical protein
MSWKLIGPPIHEGEDERELKREFARFVVANPDLEDQAGYHVFPDPADYGRAMQAQIWVHDPLVRTEMLRLKGSEAEVRIMLPTKEQLIKEVHDRAKSAEDKEAVNFYKLQAELCGFTTKAPLVDNRTINVLRVPTRDVTPEDDADFDVKFEAQQTKLVRDARSNRQIAA